MLVRVLVSSVAWWALVAAAPGPAELAKAFGSRESVQQISLSPDGTKVAYIAPRSGQASSVYTVDLVSGQSQVAASVDGNPQRLGRCNWVSNNRLACQIFAVVNSDELTPVSRMVAFDADGKNVKLLTQSDNLNQRYGNAYGGGVIDLLPADDGAILMDRWFVPEEARKTRLNNEREGYGVVRLDTRTLATKIVEEPGSLQCGIHIGWTRQSSNHGDPASIDGHRLCGGKSQLFLSKGGLEPLAAARRL